MSHSSLISAKLSIKGFQTAFSWGQDHWRDTNSELTKYEKCWNAIYTMHYTKKVLNECAIYLPNPVFIQLGLHIINGSVIFVGQHHPWFPHKKKKEDLFIGFWIFGQVNTTFMNFEAEIQSAEVKNYNKHNEAVKTEMSFHVWSDDVSPTTSVFLFSHLDFFKTSIKKHTGVLVYMYKMLNLLDLV